MRAAAVALAALSLVGLSLASAAHADDTVGLAVPGIDARAVKSWHYQLQNVEPQAIVQSAADMAVIDLAGEHADFSRAQIEAMRRKPDGTRRIVLAYMSIGEAEDYRWYWAQNAQNRAREWLGRENARWPGNYAVRFWHPQWQQIIFDYADRIVDAGFDGVYLDRVDIFEEMGHAEEMIAFVERIAQRTKARRPGFLVVAQNGDALIPNERFRHAIDGFAREDLFYGENADGVRNDADSIAESISRLRVLKAEGKPVFVVEYPKTEAQGETASREIAEQDFIGLLAKRQLDRR